MEKTLIKRDWQTELSFKKPRVYGNAELKGGAMQIFKIPETLAAKYHGCVYALCSVAGGQMVNLIYLRDIFEMFNDEDRGSILDILNDERIGPSALLLQSTGEVFVGMCSCWEFVVK